MNDYKSFLTFVQTEEEKYKLNENANQLEFYRNND